jgi:hypothetical protein
MQKKTKYRNVPCFALNFLQNGGNVFALQRIMGHTNLDMTKRYLALTQNDIREEHARSGPLTKIAAKFARATSFKKLKEEKDAERGSFFEGGRLLRFGFPYLAKRFG